MKLPSIDRRRAEIAKRLERLEAMLPPAGSPPDPASPQPTPPSPSPAWTRQELLSYRNRPVDYAREILGVRLTPDQAWILEHLHKPPCRVMVPSGHDTGKTFVAGVAVNYWYDTHPVCGIMTLGPRQDSLKDTVWAEVRLQRLRAHRPLPDDFIGPAAPEMRSAPDHWAKAATASKDASLTGRHLPYMLFLIEEACGVDPIWWTVIMTMFDASLSHAQLCIFNPTELGSQAYLEDRATETPDGEIRWHRRRLSALNHPNIAAELRGEPKVIPHAVSLKTVRGWVRDWCTPIGPRDTRRAHDFEWPPDSGDYFRPGPEFLARAAGLWPEDESGLWSDTLFQACLRDPGPFPLDLLPEIGCDTATGKGSDFHSIHARWGDVSVHHESANTMDPAAIYDRLRDTAAEQAHRVNAARPRTAEPVRATEILIKIDDDGVGRSVASFLWREGYACVPIGAATSASNPNRYPNRRSELWFAVADRARLCRGVNLSLLPAAVLRRLRQQLLPVTWELDAKGRRVVEPKADMKERLGRSPDDADAMNLAYLDGVTFTAPKQAPRPDRRDPGPSADRPSAAARRGLYGRS